MPAILYMQTRAVFEDTRKHGEVKRGHREIQFAVALLPVLKRESNSSELERKTNRMAPGRCCDISTGGCRPNVNSFRGNYVTLVIETRLWAAHLLKRVHYEVHYSCPQRER